MPVTRRRVRSEEEEIEDEEEETEEDEKPSKVKKSKAKKAKDKPAKRRPRDEDEDDDEDDDEDEAEKPSKKKVVRKGWKGHKENKAKGGDFPEEMKITGDAELIKFLEEEPFASYRQHWIDAPPNGIKKKSWTCLEDDCPLCDTGDRPRTLTAFNVLHISTGADPENKILILGNKAVGQLEGFADDPKTGPLDRLFWAVSKSGKNQSTAYNFVPVKERDLEEDWDLDPEEIASHVEEAGERLYDAEAIHVPTKKQLRELAEGLLDDDDDD